jgi:hypothetical protein
MAPLPVAVKYHADTVRERAQSTLPQTGHNLVYREMVQHSVTRLR